VDNVHTILENDNQKAGDQKSSSKIESGIYQRGDGLGRKGGKSTTARGEIGSRRTSKEESKGKRKPEATGRYPPPWRKELVPISRIEGNKRKKTNHTL